MPFLCQGKKPLPQNKDRSEATLKKLCLQILCVLLISAAAIAFCATPSRAQDPPPEELKHKVDSYLRNLFAFGPEVKLTVGEFKETGLPGLLETNITVTVDGNKEDAKMWVSKDGKFLMRGELSDMSKDPMADTRTKLDVKDAPVTGNSKATITVAEFADFECPVCRNLHEALKEVLPSYPQARLVFKDFPLEQVHPWARTGALAGRCAYQQDPKAFWKMHDFLYDKQDLISAANVWDKAVDFAGQTGLNTDTFKACMTSPEAASAVDASIANGKLLEVSSTPTVFVNGRRMVGADRHQLEQLLQYELQHASTKKN
jgi:protein-disulfide isomerase